MYLYSTLCLYNVLLCLENSWWRLEVQTLSALLSYLLGKSIRAGPQSTICCFRNSLVANIANNMAYFQLCFQFTIMTWRYLKRLLYIRHLPKRYIKLKLNPRCLSHLEVIAWYVLFRVVHFVVAVPVGDLLLQIARSNWLRSQQYGYSCPKCYTTHI